MYLLMRTHGMADTPKRDCTFANFIRVDQADKALNSAWLLATGRANLKLLLI